MVSYNKFTDKQFFSVCVHHNNPLNFKHIVNSSNDEEALLIFKYERLLMFYYDLIKK